MGRALRIEYPGALYHVMAHGNGMQWIYKNDEHIRIFKYLIKNIINKYYFKIHAIVLMQNHYHILLETQMANLSIGMKKFNQEFAKMFNKISGRKGSVFRERYKAILIEKENYYWTVLKYICQNPVRKNIVKKCEDYKGSFLNWINEKWVINYFYIDDIKKRFSEKGEWKKNFFKWLNEEKIEKIKNDSKSKYLIGNTEWLKKISGFIKNIQGEIKEKKKYYELKINENELKKINKKYSTKTALDIKIYIYNKYSSMTHKEIAQKLNIKSASSCKQRLYMFSKKIKENQKIKKKLFKIIDKILENQKNDF